MLTTPNYTEFKYESLEEAFPSVDPEFEPFGNLVLVQVRQPKRKAGAIFLIDETVSAEHYNTQIAKVIKLGPLAFHRRDDMTPWPEGAWCHPGDFVRIPKHQGDRFSIPFNRLEYETDPRTGERERKTVKDLAIFVNFKDLAILGRRTGDPLRGMAFLDS